MTARTQRVVNEVSAERERQDAKFRPPPRPDHTAPDWLAILSEEVGEVARATVQSRWAHSRVALDAETENLRAELIQVAAVAVAWIEHIDSMADMPNSNRTHG